MRIWDECPFRRVEKPRQGDEPWSAESQVDFDFQTSISIDPEMQVFPLLMRVGMLGKEYFDTKDRSLHIYNT